MKTLSLFGAALCVVALAWMGITGGQPKMEEETIVLYTTKEAIAKQIYNTNRAMVLSLKGASTERLESVAAGFANDYDDADERFQATALEYANLFIERVSK